MEINYQKMGRRIRSRRRELGLTQFALAERCGISTVYISHVENGTATPSLGVFLSIAEALEATPDYFLVDRPLPPKNTYRMASPKSSASAATPPYGWWSDSSTLFWRSSGENPAPFDKSEGKDLPLGTSWGAKFRNKNFHFFLDTALCLGYNTTNFKALNR